MSGEIVLDTPVSGGESAVWVRVPLTVSHLPFESVQICRAVCCIIHVYVKRSGRVSVYADERLCACCR